MRAGPPGPAALQGPGRPGVRARPARCQGTVYQFLLYDQMDSFGHLTNGKLYQLIRKDSGLLMPDFVVIEAAVGRSGVVR